MAKPANVGRWGDVSAPIVEPISGKKDVGWAPTERPPAQYLNWLFNVDYQWRAWLDTIVAPGSLQEGLDISSAGVLGATGKHGERSLHLDVLGINVEINSGTDTIQKTAAGGFQVTTTIASTDDFTWTKQIPLKVGDRVRRIYIPETGGSGISWTYDLIHVRPDSPFTVTVVATRSTSATPMLLPAAGNIDHVVLADRAYYLRATKANPGGSPESVAIRDISVIFDRAA